MINFKNKNILITGASGGIGNELVKKFVLLGGNVLGSGTKIEKLDLLKKKYPNIKVKKFDIAEHSRIEEFIDNVSLELGGLDILINNAGITKDGLFVRMKEDDWDSVLAVNLKGSFLCGQQAAKHMMKQRQGAIVNIASIVGIMGNAGQANYSASKSGLIGLTKTMARGLAPRNITVNAIAPGFIDTEMTRVLDEKIRDKLIEQIPLSRLGLPDDIAHSVAFLVSDRSSYITGQVLNVNGGMLM